MLMEARNADLDENIEPTELRASTKKRKVADRLKDPIVDKTQKRKTKTNLNAFKAQFLTLKKRIKKVANPSKMAGKYMVFGQGELADCFFSTGIKLYKNLKCRLQKKALLVDDVH